MTATADTEGLAARIAVHSVRLLEERDTKRRWLTAPELAEELRVKPAWVRANAERLGAIRLGTGPKAPLRFHHATAVEKLTYRSSGGRSQEPGGGSGKRNREVPLDGMTGTGAPLLPIRGSRVAKSGRSLQSRGRIETEETDGS